MVEQNLGKIAGLRLTPNDPPGFLAIRLKMQQGATVHVSIPVKSAMTMMRALQAYQRKYRWPIPMTKIEI